MRMREGKGGGSYCLTFEVSPSPDRINLKVEIKIISVSYLYCPLQYPEFPPYC